MAPLVLDPPTPEAPSPPIPNIHPNTRPKDTWLYPDEIAHDLDNQTSLPDSVIQETYTCAWEYTRSVIPVYTSWPRYLAFTRIIIIGIVAEFNGSAVDVTSQNPVLGFDLSELLATIFGDTPTQVHAAMAREYRAFLLITAEKSGNRRNSELFNRYVEALAHSPRTWFRMRDCDALVRFSIAAALACNDFDGMWFGEEQLQILGEIGCTMYDAVAFYKHRAEGETNSTFAYVDPGLREEAFRKCREVLWALDVVWGKDPARRCVVNFLRPFGGPIHMMMRRYRFVEDGLVIGRAETEGVVKETRRNVKLWNRVDVAGVAGGDRQRYLDAMEQRERVMFEGLAELLSETEDMCSNCLYKSTYGTEGIRRFGGVELCGGCRESWGSYIRSLTRRAVDAFPELRETRLVSSLE